jgi:ribosomal protein L11 methyltransferase
MSDPVCYELKIKAPLAYKDRVIERLLFMGHNSFVEGAVECDIEFDYNTEHFTHDYYDDFPNESPIVFYSENKNELESIQRDLLSGFEKDTDLKTIAQSLECVIQPIADQNWRESWKQSFKPLFVGENDRPNLVIAPPWERDTNFKATEKIIIDPGMAFGTGQHETTFLCMSLYLKHFVKLASNSRIGFESRVQNILDVGTGSGILAIAARKFGSLSVIGNDIDAPSIRIAEENAAANAVQNIEFTTRALAELPLGPYDLVFANIQFKPLVRLLPDLSKRMNHTSRIVISGILAVEKQEFEVEMNQNGLRYLEVEQKGDWIGILACRE